MMNSGKHRVWFLGARLQVASCGLMLSVLLSPVVAAQSVPEPSYSYKVLHDFCSLTNCADGGIPQAGLIQDAKGNLYGPTFGNVFKLTKAGKETVLYTFTGGT